MPYTTHTPHTIQIHRTLMYTIPSIESLLRQNMKRNLFLKWWKNCWTISLSFDCRHLYFMNFKNYLLDFIHHHRHFLIQLQLNNAYRDKRFHFNFFIHHVRIEIKINKEETAIKVLQDFHRFCSQKWPFWQISLTLISYLPD